MRWSRPHEWKKLYICSLIIIGTVVCFTVDLDLCHIHSRLAQLSCHRISAALTETAAACFICSGSIFAGHVDVTLWNRAVPCCTHRSVAEHFRVVIELPSLKKSEIIDSTLL